MRIRSYKQQNSSTGWIFESHYREQTRAAQRGLLCVRSKQNGRVLEPAVCNGRYQFFDDVRCWNYCNPARPKGAGPRHPSALLGHTLYDFKLEVSLPAEARAW
jgi:hypothetical protein